MGNKQLINGLKYEKLSEDQLYDLSQWELVDIVLAYRKDIKAKEQECEELKEKCRKYGKINEQETKDYAELKAEVKSKTEYIQEQRGIINQYSKEIEMYKKCQGKRASKREEELKAENDNIKETFDGLFKVQYKLADNNKKLRQCLTEIKEIAEENDELLQGYHKEWANNKLILQKISEVIPNEKV